MDTEDTRLIRQVRLQNLLSFGPDTPPLELENLNVLIGPNGCGKSNFIDAIALMRATPSSILEAAQKAGGVDNLNWKGDTKNFTTIEFIIQTNSFSLIHLIAFQTGHGLLFIHEESISDTSTEADQPVQHYRSDGTFASITREKSPFFEELTRDIEVDNESSILSQLNDPWSFKQLAKLSNSYSNTMIYRDWIFGSRSLLRYPQKADLSVKYLMEDFSNYFLFLNKLSRNLPDKKAVINGLQDLYEGIDDFGVDILPGGYIDFRINEGDYSIPATRLSDGTLRYLCLMAILHDPEPPPLICIEEPELGLHPDILPTLADHLIAASERTQLIVTTHSDILVDAMTDRPEVVVVCEKHDGKTEMKRLDRESLKVWLDKYRLGELWIKGELGGKRW